MTEPVDPFLLLRESIRAEFANVNQRMDDRFDNMNTRIVDLHEDIDRQMNRLSEALWGNGQPGLIRTVEKHDTILTDLDRNEGRIAAKHGGTWGAVGGVIAAVVVGVLSYLGIKPQ